MSDVARAIKVAADAIFTWKKPDDGNPDWDRRFMAWQASLAAELAVKALDEAGLLVHSPDGDSHG